MKLHYECGRNIPVYGSYDVVVCGGGATGFVAAIASARRGAKTLLIERYGFLGGTATASMMLEFGPMHDGRQQLVGGITHEFLHRLESYGGAYFTNTTTHAMVFNPESMIAVCQAMVEEAGVEMLLHAWLAGAIVDDGRVVGVIAESKSGRQAVLAKTVIDCTGDGDIAARAGATWEMGRPGDHKVQPVSMEILVGDVDATKVAASLVHNDFIRRMCELNPKIAEAKARGEWTIPTEQLFSWGRVLKRGLKDDPHRSFFFVNGTNAVDVDATDARSLTAAELQTRREVEEMLTFLKRNAPGFENCYLDRVAVQLGVRETRRITGDAMLTRDDVITGRHFPDGVVPSCMSIDVHDVSGKAFSHERVRENSHYQIPYGCFLPKGLEGLLVAGRCISADHWALGSARVMIVTMPMGEAVGVAAALASGRGVTPRAVPVEDIRRLIREGGTVLE